MDTETITYKSHKIEIEQDDSAENPRTHHDPISTIVANEITYNESEHTDYSSINDWLEYETWEDIKKHYIFNVKIVAILPLYLRNDWVDTLNTTQQGRQIGFIYITKESWNNQMGTDFDSHKQKRSLANRYIKAEIETLNNWLMNDCYGWTIPSLMESCWGFYGSDHSKSGLLESAKNEIDHDLRYKHKIHLEKLKKYIKGNTPIQYRFTT